MSAEWWNKLPRKIYSSLEKIETRQSWYSVYKIHDWLYALYEDGQYDETLMYLVIGKKKAALIDGGTGIGRLDKLVKELTDKQCFLILTHTHNDHIGACTDFDEIWLYDDCMSWESAAKGLSMEKMREMIEPGAVIKPYPKSFNPNNFNAPPYTVSNWLKDGEIIDLGNRILEVIYTPGHSSNHICLLDKEAKYLYTGDIYYTGAVTSYLPGGCHNDFIQSCRKLTELMPHYDFLMPAHNEPLVEKEQMQEMYEASKGIKDGTITEYIKHRAFAVNYSLDVRRYQFTRFSLSVREEIFQ
jgi:glyoxylase-like metal-dependent hydrolase (beta-lactamase superfamily II)